MSFYGFNPASNPLYANLLGSQSPIGQNPLFTRLQGNNTFSNVRDSYSNVFNPSIIQQGLNAYNQGMSQFKPFNQQEFDAEKARKEAEKLAAQKPVQNNMAGLFYNPRTGNVGSIESLYGMEKPRNGTGKLPFGGASFRIASGRAAKAGKPIEEMLGYKPLGGQ